MRLFCSARGYLCVLGLAAVLSFVVTFTVEPIVAQVQCYQGVSCTINSTTCGFCGGSLCANAGGTQDVDQTKPIQGHNGWISIHAPCGTVLDWSAPYICDTPTSNTCGHDSQTCPN
jgi:hypothetical protein